MMADKAQGCAPAPNKERTVLLRIGNCDAEIRVAAVMSTPRLGFTDNFFCVASALAPHGISPMKVTGAYWGQCLQRAMEQVVNEHDVILTIDYDTVFNSRTVEALLALLMHSGMDAIAPLQTKRETNAVMLALPGVSASEKTEVGTDFFEKVVQPVATAHFGLTFLRTSALKKMKKPWFVSSPNNKGEWDGDHIDEDIGFWKSWAACGNTLGVATQISVGHAELMITWPSRTDAGGKVQQHTTDYWGNGQKAPKEAWGYAN
jgi:hypothetical protein